MQMPEDGLGQIAVLLLGIVVVMIGMAVGMGVKTLFNEFRWLLPARLNCERRKVRRLRRSSGDPRRGSGTDRESIRFGLPNRRFNSGRRHGLSERRRHREVLVTK